MSFFGIRISFTVHRSGWLLIAVLIALGCRDLGPQRGILAGLLVALSLLAHELGHVLAAFFFHVPVHAVGIKFKGAYTLRKYADRPLHDVLIAGAGPFANLVLMFASFFVPRIGVWLAEWNCAIALFNLLPIPATDGFRIVKTIFRPDSSIYPSARRLPEPA